MTTPTTEKQLSRVAGCPRLPLNVFKAFAELKFIGKGPTRKEQQNGKESKVQLLRKLAANDPAVRSELIKFAKEYQANRTRKLAAEQGLTLATPGAARTSDDEEVDRLVRELEAAEMSVPRTSPPVLSRGLCGHPGCTKEWKTDFFGVRRCDEHHQPERTFASSAPAGPLSPAEYINSGFGKNPQAEAFDPDRPQAGDTPYIAGLKALRQAQLDAAAIVPRGSHYGPTPEGAIVVSAYSSPDEK
jgi:hypothetical protein